MRFVKMGEILMNSLTKNDEMQGTSLNNSGVCECLTFNKCYT
jgi:hypothetical protein